MLARKNRIATKEFPTFRNKGIRFVSGLFSGTTYLNPQKIQVSVVVSKKTAKTAVARNKTRRRFYAVVSPLIKKLTGGAMIVFYPKSEAIIAPLPIIRTEIEGMLRKAGLLK